MNRRIFIYFAFCFLLFVFKLFAQDTWIKTYSPFNADSYSVEDVAVCSDGGYAINGLYFILDPWGGYEEWWGFLIKTDNNGNLLWAKKDTISFQNENESLAFVETSDGGFISAVSGGNLIKRDSNGNREWVINGDFGINSMCPTDDGNIILGGCQDLNIGLRKIDESGNVLWTKVYPFDDSDSVCKSIIQTSDGGYALTGYIDYYDPLGEGDVLIIKADAIGDTIWTKRINGYNGSGGRDRGWSILQNTENAFFVSGYFESNSDTYYGFLVKLDEENNQIFLLSEENSQDYYLFRSMVDFEINNEIIGYGRIENEINLLSYDYEGEFLWNSSLPIRTAIGDRCLQKINNGLILCARSMDWDIALVKTDAWGQISSINQNVIYNVNYNLSNYPNPFNPSTLIQFTLPQHIKNSSVEIFNIKGQLVEKIPIGTKQSSVEWFAAKKTSGIYFYRIKSDNRISETKKMTLLK